MSLSRIRRLGNFKSISSCLSKHTHTHTIFTKQILGLFVGISWEGELKLIFKLVFNFLRGKRYIFKKLFQLFFDDTAQWASQYSMFLGYLTFSWLWRCGGSVGVTSRLNCYTWRTVFETIRKNIGKHTDVCYSSKIILFIYWKPSGHFLFIGVKTFGLQFKICHCKAQQACALFLSEVNYDNGYPWKHS